MPTYSQVQLLIKKFLVLLMAMLVIGAVGLSATYRQLPTLAVRVLKNTLNKDVQISDVAYLFPMGLKVENLTVRGSGEFEGENSLFVPETVLRVNPLSLIRGKLELTSLHINKPQIIIRRFKGRVYHTLSVKKTPQPSDGKAIQKPSSEKKESDWIIHKLKIQNGILRYVDYDIASNGFAINVQRIEAEFENVSPVPWEKPFRYDIQSEIVQGRDSKPAKITCRGRTEGAHSDTEAILRVKDLWLPYFEPYYRKVTTSTITRGLADTRATVRSANQKWEANARVNLRQLKFGSYETGEKLFGIDARSLIELLKNRSDTMTLDLRMRWDFRDPTLTFRKALRQSIQDSLKATFLANIQNVIDNTLDKFGKEGSEFIGGDWREFIDEIRQVVD